MSPTRSQIDVSQPPGPVGAKPDLGPIAVALTKALRDVLSYDNLKWLTVVDGPPPTGVANPVTLQWVIAGVSEERSSYEQPWVWNFGNGASAPYSAVHHGRNHAARAALVFSVNGRPRGSTVWHANLRYGALAMQGQYTHQSWYPHRAAPTFLPPSEVVTHLAANLQDKVLFQAPAWAARLAEAVRKKVSLNIPADQALDRADREWAQYRFQLASNLRPADRDEREAGFRLALGLPPAEASHTPTGVAARMLSSGLPFENSLGMRFMPISDTDFALSIWETRVRDYRAFVDATGHVSTSAAHTLTADGWRFLNGTTWATPGFAQTPEHPVVAVSHADAVAFCAWLTVRERSLGLIGPSESYRLPTDEQWSAGNWCSPGQHPWGAGWPPPRGAGNFAGYEIADGHWPWAAGALPDWDDAFPRTAPVGSFSANAYGLHDLAGNVAEMLRDPPDAKGEIVARGGAFNNNTIENLLTTHRARWGGPAVVLGFRVVLVRDEP